MPRNKAKTVDDFPEPVLQTISECFSVRIREHHLPPANANFKTAFKIEREVFQSMRKVMTEKCMCNTSMNRMDEMDEPIFHREI